MHHRQSIILLGLGLAALGSTAHPQGTLRFENCQIGAADAPARMQARCTTLEVPEDRAHPAGRKIGLHIAVLKARGSDRQSDPLFFLAGGPGQAATDSYVQEAPAFDRINADRDIVLVDQRGTGQSNPLNCPKSPGLAESASEKTVKQAVQACLKQLPGDPRFYTTSVAVEDLDAVRVALGYSAINLYGISYGTRVALQYMREYPEHTRSVVLDGVVPADLSLGPDVSLDAQHALGLIFTRCDGDPACHKAFPDPAGNFAALERDIDKRTVSVTLRDPLSGAPRTETLTWDKVAQAVRFMSYQSETASLLPLLIHQAAVQHDYAPLMGAALIFSSALESSFAEGMANSVLCTEDAPFLKNGTQQARAGRDTYLGGHTLDMLVKTCRFWPKGVIASGFKLPVKSDKPVLLLSGEDDPITPPANAAHAGKTLRDSLSLVVPGQGHGNVFRGCLPRLVTEFVARASTQGLDTTCVKQIKPFPFFVNFSGPSP